MKIVLLGKNGQVGWELQRALAPLGEVIALGRNEADIERPEALAGAVARHAPDIIVNAAAYTAVDKAETEPDRAALANAAAVGRLAEAAARGNALLIHYSTDYVFDGVREDPHTEDEETNPLGVYGRTKRDGELAVMGSGCRHAIIRTSWVFASRGQNFIRTILRLAAERDSLRIVADQTGAPTGADLIADISAIMIGQMARNDGGQSGIYHLAAAGSTTWHAYARHIVARAQAAGRTLRCVPEAIDPISTAEFGAKAPRPLNSQLGTDKLRTTFGVRLPDWRTGVDRAIDELLGAQG